MPGIVPTISHCEIRDNRSTYSSVGGSGLACRNASPAIIDCTIDGNYTSPLSYGGGAYCSGSSAPRLIGCRIIGSSAGSGGGIQCSQNSNAELIGCTIHGNVPDGMGFSYLGTASLTNCIVWGNLGKSLDTDESLNVRYSSIHEGGDIGPFPHLPLPGSPLVDSGDPSTRDGVFDTHPRWPRAFPNGERADIGAHGGNENMRWVNE